MAAARMAAPVIEQRPPTPSLKSRSGPLIDVEAARSGLPEQFAGALDRFARCCDREEWQAEGAGHLFAALAQLVPRIGVALRGFSTSSSISRIHVAEDPSGAPPWRAVTMGNFERSWKKN
ncbi:hypothetical protein [Achromobacter sp.]|uniref:hypothetical protein n=1 Tax=Achromobacter sp. TaxID=134375 RepID=UPI0028A23223|nr:hypothetical protein [Achromobacter sp.]